MLLMVEVFAFNAMSSCVSFYHYSQTKSIFDLPLVFDVRAGSKTETTTLASASIAVNEKTNVEEYLRRMIVGTRDMRRKMYVSSTAASIVLGVVSYIAIQYDY